MVEEHAEISITPGTEEEFEAAFAKSVPLFERAKGFGGVKLMKCVEVADKYRLVVKWETVEDHVIAFRESEDFASWRGLVGGYFAGSPEVYHYENTGK